MGKNCDMPSMKVCILEAFKVLFDAREPIHYQDIVNKICERLGIDKNEYYNNENSRFDENLRTGMQMDEKFRIMDDANDPQWQGRGNGYFGLRQWYTRSGKEQMTLNLIDNNNPILNIQSKSKKNKKQSKPNIPNILPPVQRDLKSDIKMCYEKSGVIPKII